MTKYNHFIVKNGKIVGSSKGEKTEIYLMCNIQTKISIIAACCDFECEKYELNWSIPFLLPVRKPDHEFMSHRIFKLSEVELDIYFPIIEFNDVLKSKNK